MQIPVVAVDTNVWIAAAERQDPDALGVVALREAGLVLLRVSRHTLHELKEAADRHGATAHALAAVAVPLPCYPTGAIADLAGPIAGLAGSLAEVETTDSLRARLAEIARSGTDLRDRGALIDSHRAGVDIFISFDNGIVGAGPRERLLQQLGLHVMRPGELVDLVTTGNLSSTSPKGSADTGK